MSSRHSMNRASLTHHKQQIVTREKKEQPKYDVKPSVGVQTHSRHSSARNKNVAETSERSDELQQNLENDKRLILQLSADVTRTNEEYKQLCHEFDKKEDWHRISGLPTMINDVKSKITDLERKLLYYAKECSKLKEENGEFKTRIMQLKGKCLVLAKKQKLGKEQMNAPKNLMNRQKAQGAHVTMSPTSRYRVINLDRIKAEKLEIDTLLRQYQSDLDNLIKAERRLREIINGLQDSNAIVKNDSQKLKLTAAKCDRKHKKEKEGVQRTVTKQAHHNSQTDVFRQSSGNLYVITDKASNQVAVEAYRAKLEVTECELKNCKATIEILERRIGECQPNELNDKFQEQLVQTGEQLEEKWIRITKEKDQRIAELEKQINDMDEAINHKKQHQIEELKLRLERMSNDSESTMSTLTKENENYKSVVAQKDLELKKYQERLERMSNDSASKMSTLTKENENYKSVVAQKDLELKKYQERLKKMSNDNASTMSTLTKDNENYKSVVAQRDLEFKKYQERLERISNDSASTMSTLTKENENYKSVVAQKDLELKKYQESLTEKTKKLKMASEDFKSSQRNLENQIETLKADHKKLEKDLNGKELELIKAKQQCESLQSSIVQQNEELKQLHKRMSNDDKASKISKLSKVSENHKLNLTQKDLELKRCQERLKETSTKQELQKHELNEANKTVESMRADLALKDMEIETYNKNLTEERMKLKMASDKFKLSQRNLESQIETLKDDHKKLENDLKGKELELIKAQQQCKSLQSSIVQQNEELKNLHKSRREKSMSPPSKQKENEEQNFKKYENFPKKSLIEKLVDTERDLKKCQESLLKYEEKSFKFTNAFTSAGEGSVLDMSKRYRHIQHNKRAAAARAIKKVNKIDAREHLCGQIMCAYETAKALVLDEARNCIKNNLYELQKDDRTPRNQELLQGCMMVLSCIEEDERIKKTAINQIHEKLIPDRMQLPPEVEDYYQSLAELTWCAVARPIPMIIAKSPESYCKMCHELKDGEDVEDGRAVSYVYPVLYSSNEWPRQVAQEGRVVLKT